MTDVAVPPSTGLERPAARRGTTQIADRVVAKIAARSAAEVDGVEPRQATWLGRLFGGSASSPDVDADVAGTAATVEVTIGVRYPRPVWDTAARVRGHVADRLSQLAGLTEVEVRVEVAELVTAKRPSGPRVRPT